MLYAPLVSDCAVRVSPVSMCLTVIADSGTAAPDASLTVPYYDSSTEAETTTTLNNTSNTVDSDDFFFKLSWLFYNCHLKLQSCSTSCFG